MKLMIHSFRGEHACDCAPAVAEALFNKLTGKTEEALPVALKTEIPATFQELEELWRPGKLPFLAADESNELVLAFRPEIKEMIFLAEIIGG